MKFTLSQPDRTVEFSVDNLEVTSESGRLIIDIIKGLARAEMGPEQMVLRAMDILKALSDIEVLDEETEEVIPFLIASKQIKDNDKDREIPSGENALLSIDGLDDKHTKVVFLRQDGNNKEFLHLRVFLYRARNLFI